MKLIDNNKLLASNLSRLIRSYPNIMIAVAWASSNTEIFKLLKEKQIKIQKAIIGTHFYQTHPNVLDTFIASKNVRFILQPNGVFHPKIYFFWNRTSWEVLIGSANLTAAALTKNSEVMILLSNLDDGVPVLKKQIVGLVESYWPHAKPVTKQEALAYRTQWLAKRPDIRRLSGVYGKRKSSKPPINSSVMSMSWRQFVAAVDRRGRGRTDKRCTLLREVRDAFLKHQHFSQMDIELRKAICGLYSTVPNSRLFGSMIGNGRFYRAVNRNNHYLSSALDRIPLSGLVSRAQYEDSIKEYKKAFPNGRHGIATASRILALKRPDQFVCIDSKNNQGLCADFGITKSGMSYVRYWQEIIERITDAPWWNETKPNNIRESRIWDGRAAMLDAIFYRK
jgi:HKD family nuclease